MTDTHQFEAVQPPEASASAAGSALDTALGWLCAVNGLLALGLCWLQPQNSIGWVIALLVLPVAIYAVRHLPQLSDLPESARRSLSWSLLVTGLIVLVPLILRLLEATGGLEYVTMRRMLGAGLGAGLFVIGTLLPQRVAPLAWSRFGALLAARLGRLLGNAVICAGVVYGTIWLIAPLAVANLSASLAIAVIAAGAGLYALLIVKRASH